MVKRSATRSYMAESHAFTTLGRIRQLTQAILQCPFVSEASGFLSNRITTVVFNPLEFVFDKKNFSLMLHSKYVFTAVLNFST